MLNIIIPVAGYEPDINEIIRILAEVDTNIIIVINGNADISYHEHQYPALTFLHLPSPQSPYSARNLGLSRAQPGPVAFLDASCIPKDDWVMKGLAALATGVDIVAGKVEFRFQSEMPTAAELWDSVSNIQQEYSVQRGVAKTANLFASENALAVLGPFKDGVRSGEDVRWTGQSSRLGLQLKYVDDVVVYKRARTLIALLRKNLRTGAGKAAHQGLAARLLLSARLILLPVSPWLTSRLITQRSTIRCSYMALTKVWLVAWLCGIFHGLGMLLPSIFYQAD